jgi:signal transduction histidine kinase
LKLPFFLRRTLARRVFVTVALALVLIWCWSIADQWIQVNAAFEKDVVENGLNIRTQVEHIDDPQVARTTVEAISVALNNGFRQSGVVDCVLLELADGAGNTIYRSPEAGAVRMLDFPEGLSEQSLGRGSYHVEKARTGRWTLVYATRIWDLPMVLKLNGSDTWRFLLIELPFVVLPLWFALWRGLRPLRRLVQELANKGKDDLNPIVSDVRYDDMKPLTHALDRLLAQLREKVEREHAFVQDAAHELRTPLAVISAQAHVLALADTPEGRREAEQRMDLAVERASRLVQQLLQLARAEGLRPLDNETFDLAGAVRQQLAAAVPAAIERDIDLCCEAPEKMPVCVEREAFQSILQNLLDNALRYVHRGGQVMVELCMEGTRCVLTVADNGPGIDASERARVFERFYRPAGQDASGSGLGLSIVKHAAERLGGGVMLSGGPSGRGCRFAVSFPLAGN